MSTIEEVHSRMLSTTDDEAKEISLVIGAPCSGKTALALFIAGRRMKQSGGKLTFVQSDSISFKKGSFYNQRHTALELATNLYKTYPSKFEHMSTSDALNSLQLSRMIPGMLTNRSEFLIDESLSEQLLAEILNNDGVRKVILCFRGFEEIPLRLFDELMSKTTSVYLKSTPAEFSLDYTGRELGSFPELFGSDPSFVAEALSKLHSKTNQHSEFAVCQKSGSSPLVFRQWIDGEIDVKDVSGQLKVS